VITPTDAPCTCALLACSSPVVTIVSRRLGNVPELKINAFEYYRTYPYRTDQWYFKDAQ
jgi:hypothetical protein